MMNRDDVKMIKCRYPKGTRVMLDYMDDPYAPIQTGTIGTVDYVDDAGTIHMKWDNGSSLGICPDVDSFHIIKKEEM